MSILDEQTNVVMIDKAPPAMGLISTCMTKEQQGKCGPGTGTNKRRGVNSQPRWEKTKKQDMKLVYVDGLQWLAALTLQCASR